MDWPVKARSVAKSSPSPELVFRMSPPQDSYSFPTPVEAIARAPSGVMARARIQSAVGSVPMTPEAQAAAWEATERRVFAHPSLKNPFASSRYGRRGPPPQPSSSRAPADSHHQSQASHHSHRPSALAHGYSMENEDNDKGKGKVVYTHAGGAHASRSGGDAYKAHTSTTPKVHKFYVNDDDDDEDDEEYSDDEELNRKMAGLSTRYRSEDRRGATSGGQQQYWSTMTDVPKRSPQPAHSQTRQLRPSVTVQPEQHVEHVKQQRVQSSRHTSKSKKKSRSSHTRSHHVHHSPASPGYAAPTSGTHRLHALAYPHSPNGPFPHPSASEGRSAPIPVPFYSPPEWSDNIARSYRESDAQRDEFKKRYFSS